MTYEIPAPPFPLLSVGKRVWAQIWENNDHLTSSDELLVYRLCLHFQEMHRFRGVVKKEADLLWINDDKTVVLNYSHKHILEIERQISELQRELLITPRQRKQFLEAEEKPVDPILEKYGI